LLEALSAYGTGLKVPFDTSRAKEVMLEARKHVGIRIRNFKADYAFQFFSGFFVNLEYCIYSFRS